MLKKNRYLINIESEATPRYPTLCHFIYTRVASVSTRDDLLTSVSTLLVQVRDLIDS